MGCIHSRQRPEFKTAFPPPPRPAEEVEAEEHSAALQRRAAEAKEAAERAVLAEKRAAARALAAEKRAAAKALEAEKAQAVADAEAARLAAEANTLKLEKDDLAEHGRLADDDLTRAEKETAQVPPPLKQATASDPNAPHVIPPPPPPPMPYSVRKDPEVHARASIFEELAKPAGIPPPPPPPPPFMVSGQRSRQLVSNFERMAAEGVEKREHSEMYTMHAPNGVARNLQKQFESMEIPDPPRPPPGPSTSNGVTRSLQQQFESMQSPPPVSPSNGFVSDMSDITGNESCESPTFKPSPAKGTRIAATLSEYERLDAAAKEKPILRTVNEAEGGYNAITSTLSEYERLAEEASQPPESRKVDTSAVSGNRVADKLRAFERRNRLGNLSQGYHSVEQMEARQQQIYEMAGLPTSPVTPVSSYGRSTRPVIPVKSNVGVADRLRLYEMRDAAVKGSIPPLRSSSADVVGSSSGVADKRRMFERRGDGVEELPTERRGGTGGIRRGMAAQIAAKYEQKDEMESDEKILEQPKVVTGISKVKLMSMLQAYEVKDQIAAEEMKIQEYEQRKRVAQHTMQSLETEAEE